MNQTLRSSMKEMRDGICRSETLFRLYLVLRYGAYPRSVVPNTYPENAVLQTKSEWEGAVKEVKRLKLPPHVDPPKNWDSLAALSCILRRTGKDASVLDAGGEKYSQILPWLYLLGYRNLWCINLSFQGPARWGPIRFEPGDITRTQFGAESLDVITCLSVIEHGVPTEVFLNEAARILKPGGLLILSTDYYPFKVDTHGARAFGAPIRIFDAGDIKAALRMAGERGLFPTSEVPFGCEEKPIRWQEYSLEFSYLFMTLQKSRHLVES